MTAMTATRTRKPRTRKTAAKPAAAPEVTEDSTEDSQDTGTTEAETSQDPDAATEPSLPDSDDPAGWDEAAAAAQAEADAALASGLVEQTPGSPLTEVEPPELRAVPDADGGTQVIPVGQPDPPDTSGGPGSDTRHLDGHDEPEFTPPVELDAASEHEAAEKTGADLDDEPVAEPGQVIAGVTMTPVPPLTDEETAEATKPVLFTVTVPAGLVGAFTAEVDDNWPTVTLAIKTARKSGGSSSARKEPKGLPFPAGVIAPIAFHKLIIAEKLVPQTLRAMTIYEWINRAVNNGFPVTYYAEDGTASATKHISEATGKATNRPGVDVKKGRAWCLAKFAGQDSPTAAPAEPQPATA